jgi:hypothetical protein
MVPPCEELELAPPVRDRAVNAPRTGRDSSLSISSSGIAAQFASMNGPVRRRLIW